MANALKARRCGLMKIKRKIHGNRMRMSIKSNDTLYTSRCAAAGMKSVAKRPPQAENPVNQDSFLCRFWTDFVFFRYIFLAKNDCHCTVLVSIFTASWKEPSWPQSHCLYL